MYLKSAYRVERVFAEGSVRSVSLAGGIPHCQLVLIPGQTGCIMPSVMCTSGRLANPEPVLLLSGAAHSFTPRFLETLGNAPVWMLG